MEFYRKLCNNLYWKRLKPHTASYNTRFWMIIFTALSMIWLAFYYNPGDPANSNSSGFIILLFALIYKRSGISFHAFVKNLSKSVNHKIDLITYHILDSGNISLWRSREHIYGNPHSSFNQLIYGNFNCNFIAMNNSIRQAMLNSAICHRNNGTT